MTTKMSPRKRSRRRSRRRSPRKRSRRRSRRRSPRKRSRRRSRRRSPRKRSRRRSPRKRWRRRSRSINVVLRKSSDSRKKFDAEVTDSKGTTTVRFGARGYSDYTKHKDPDRKQRYITRHRKNENWKISGVRSAGFWSRWILWGKPTLRGSIRALERKFPRITIVYKK